MVALHRDSLDQKQKESIATSSVGRMNRLHELKSEFLCQGGLGRLDCHCFDNANGCGRYLMEIYLCKWLER